MVNIMQTLNAQRYWQNIMSLAEITDPTHPYTRRSFTPLFLKGRQWLTEKMQSAGLTVHIDASGNLIGKKIGKCPNLGSIVIGSHSDSVPSGGRFDGIAGVLAGLEFAAYCQENNIILNHTLEIIDFLAEEPSEWGISCIGSRGMTGKLSAESLKIPHPNTQETLYDAIKRMGGNPQHLAPRQDIAAFFELHIEQGIVLETLNYDVGIISGIVGITRLKINFQGQADHAGATPMSLRQDALLAAAQTIIQADTLAHHFAKEKEDIYFVATCGQISVKPNASNVIVGESEITFDIRSNCAEAMEKYTQLLHQIAEKEAQQAKVRLTNFTLLSRTEPVDCHQDLIARCVESSQAQGISYQIMSSGAGHDAAFMTHIAPSVMIFVPSLKGKSHTPEEWTSEDQLGKGLSVLTKAVLDFDSTSQF